MDLREQYKQRRDELLKAAREIAQTAQVGNRGLTAEEQSQIDAALVEVRDINAKFAADAKSRQVMSALDAMTPPTQDLRQDGVAPLLGLPGDGQRLSFGRKMADLASSKIMPSEYGQKAVAPSGSVLVPQQFTADPVALGQPPTSLLSVLPVTVQPSPEFAYLRQSVRTNAAAIVPEGNVKPTSVYSVVRVQDRLDVIAHLSEAVPRLWVVDSPALQQFLSNELTYGLALAVQAMAIADIAGASGIQSNAFSTSTLQTLRKSLTRLEGNGYAPATFVLHPGDFESIELALSTVNAVEHMSLPYDAAARRLWGVPITVTNAQSVGTAHTLAQGAVGLNTGPEGVQIAWSETSNADDWSRNLIRARCEGRYATSVFSPLGVVQSELGA
jgi:HK97 family phage major capsid protein